jgi:hypothetical protein
MVGSQWDSWSFKVPMTPGEWTLRGPDSRLSGRSHAKPSGVSGTASIRRATEAKNRLKMVTRQKRKAIETCLFPHASLGPSPYFLLSFPFPSFQFFHFSAHCPTLFFAVFFLSPVAFKVYFALGGWLARVISSVKHCKGTENFFSAKTTRHRIFRHRIARHASVVHRKTCFCGNFRFENDPTSGRKTKGQGRLNPDLPHLALTTRPPK